MEKDSKGSVRQPRDELFYQEAIVAPRLKEQMKEACYTQVTYWKTELQKACQKPKPLLKMMSQGSKSGENLLLFWTQTQQSMG